ncbi:hypothetical protein ASZ90_015682 [hydrocarbon metagenome]|uniref:Uncharacterized protein n=1 Tax=hydrocarbon metagenome TaxID=938273 RepID=A0A0W8F1A9_9ZZZZ
MTPPIAIARESPSSLSQWEQDQERARRRIAYLEEQAAAFTQAGKTVPAAASRRTARLVRYLWCLEDGSQLREDL